MGITVAVKLEHLALPKILTSTSADQSGLVLVPNLDHYGTVKDTVKIFIRNNFFIAEELQVIQAPLFRKLGEKESVEYIYKRYACQTEIETSDIHLDEDNLTFFAREGGRTVELEENQKLEDYHILDMTVLQLRRLPQPLPEEGGRIFVETKDGILPLLHVTYQTQVIELKHALERMTGIPVDKQLLSTVGRVMHDDFQMKDFEGPHRVCEDSTLDLCKSGDSNVEQGHKRMVIFINVMGEQTITMVVQSRDLVQSILQVVEARTGVATWQQRITFSGKVLQEKKTLGEYYVHPECTLQITIFRSPCKPPQKFVNTLHSSENSGMDENKPAARKIKLLRTSKGRENGSITIPVLTTDTVSDLRRKVRRTLQPLTERNFLVMHGPAAESNGGSKTPSPSSRSKGGEGGGGRRLSRVLSFTGKTLSGQVSNATSPAMSTTGSVCPSPESSVKGSGSKPLAARMLSMRNFSGPLLPSPSKGAQTSSTPPTSSDRTVNDPSDNAGQGSNTKTSAARALAFKNYSGPLVVNPNKGVQPTAAPLFPPPLKSPREAASPAKPFGSNGVNTAAIGGQLTGFKVSAPKRTGENEQPSLAGSPKKFVHTRQDPISSNAGPGHSRAPSVGSIHFTPTELHSLPEPCAPIPLPETPPNVISPTARVPTSSKKLNQPGQGSEKKGLGAWLSDSMQTLKEHIRAPFTER
ncbi:hypothetical protein Mapa_014670 [Marchantia paleacea]|nr:hypothetical protein Mapa_014670 [Marchantia paleacea]